MANAKEELKNALKSAMEQFHPKTYSVTFSDGTKLENLTLNGNNFISSTPLTEDTFKDKLSQVIFSDGESSDVHTNMELVKLYAVGDGTGFILNDIPEEEIEKTKIKSDIEYVAMMCDVEL